MPTRSPNRWCVAGVLRMLIACAGLCRLCGSDGQDVVDFHFEPAEKPNGAPLLFSPIVLGGSVLSVGRVINA